MGEAIRRLPQTPSLRRKGRDANSASTGDPRSIGAYLKRQRKLRGLSLREVEAATRVPRRSLERLEAGAYDRDPDGFARGFVRTVSEAIGLDPEETIARMLVEPEVRRGDPATRARTRWWIAGAGVTAVLLFLLLLGSIRTFRTLTIVPVAGETSLRRFDAVRALAEQSGVLEGELPELRAREPHTVRGPDE